MHHFLPRVLPQGLEPLTELALDLRWTWSHAGDALWRQLDPVLWERTRNPWAILQNASQSALEKLSAAKAFRSELERAIGDRERYLRDPAWCGELHPDFQKKTVAYFSMEFGLSEAFPLYAGGLGVLAGDMLKTASDLAAPIVGVGLLYQEGYFRQMVDARGRQREAYPYNNPTDLPIQPVTGSDEAWLRIEVRLPGRILHLRVWQANVGRVRLYLLDSNDLVNGPGDRGITAKLYGGSSETRLLQEIILGIGGWSLLETLGIEADVCHLNEGHAAFAVVERASRFMKQHGASFREAWWATRAGNVFTTHTPVAAGIDAFSPRLIEQYFRDGVREAGISLQEFLALGRRNAADDDEAFNMAYLALRGCARCNAVSRLHGGVSRRLFSPLYARWPEREVPIGHVTNGIHVPSWDSLWADRLWTAACGKGRWMGAVNGLADLLREIDDETLWRLAAEERRDLVRYARERLAWQLGQRGAAPDRIRAAAEVLDPNVLILGFARRFAEYKRPNLLLRDPARLTRLLLDPARPVQIIVAGKAHPDDEAGKRLVQQWLEFVNRPEVRARAVFLEDYDMALAQQLVQGVDLWINTPHRTWEACGTSGMKVLANGGLNLSVLDGWWAEAYTPETGWAIGDAAATEDQADERDAAQLYRVLEAEVVPEFYDRDSHGIPKRWVERMRASIARLAPQFSSNRMLEQYLERLYHPAAMDFARRSAGRGKLAKELCAWEGRLAAGWHEIHFGETNAERKDDRWHFAVRVYLGGVSPDAIGVELYADAADGEAPARQRMSRGAPIPGAVNGYIYEAAVPASRPASHYTARVIAWHPEAHAPAEVAFVLWQK